MVNDGNIFICIKSASIHFTQMKENVGHIYWSDLTSKEMYAQDHLLTVIKSIASLGF